MAKRSSTKEEEEDEQKEEDAEHYEDHDSDEDVEGGGEEEEEEQQQQQQELEYGRKKVMIRVVSAGQRLSTFVPFVNSTSSSTSGIGSLRCQADECGADLRMAKAYHKRHKVCERHAKAAVVLVSGVRQRFCQQCSKY